MKYLDSKVLESLIIEDNEVATEGVIGAIAISILLLPTVLIGGVAFVAGALVKIEEAKLKKKIKENKGKLADYGSSSYTIFNQYSKDITEVQEPEELSKVLLVYEKNLKVAKQLANIRNQFNSIDPTKPENDSKFKALYKMLENLDKQYISPDSISVNSDKIHSSSLSNSYIYKCSAIKAEISKYAYGGADWGEGIIINMKHAEEDPWNNYYKNETAAEVIEIYDQWAYSFIDDDTLDKYLVKCKFAVKKSAKPNKGIR